METDVKILVRERELACRNAWGDDLWADASSPATTSPPDQARKSFSYLHSRLDDEVTSVVDASTRPVVPNTGDDVVTVTAVRSSENLTPTPTNDVNHAAVADQEERARVMARGTRDAIASARKRHVARRGQVTSVDASGDDVVSPSEILEETGSAAPNLSPDESSTNDNPGTLPEPVLSADTVASDVGLNRLRNFLRGEEAFQHSPSSPFTSHFDHVMMQAERIKERADARRPQVTLSADQPTDRGLEVESLDHPVIWDVNPATLDIEFHRVHVTHVSEIEENERKVEFEAGLPQPGDRSIVEPPARISIYQQAPPAVARQAIQDLLPMEEQDASAEDDLHHLESSSDEAFVDADFDNDLVVAEDSPRSSLWRSVNQRIRQRFRFNSPHPQKYNREYEIEPELEADFEVSGAAPEILDAHGGFQSGDPDTWYAPESNDHAADSFDQDDVLWIPDGDDGAFESELGTWHMTSEESWRLDEREFPEPHPSHWHESRRELLASLPPVEALDDSVQFVAPTPQSRPAEPIKPQRPRVDPSSFFDISEPGGLAMFRAALFGSQAQSREQAFSPEIADYASGFPVTDSRQESPADRARPSRRQDLLPEPLEVFDRAGQSQPSRARSLHSYPAAGQERPARVETASKSMRVAQREPAEDLEFDAEVATFGRRSDLKATDITFGDKRCATCRSFQPTDDGTRGRCTNSWASARRSMVHADELACRSSFGDWWIAADGVWTHGRPSDAFETSPHDGHDWDPIESRETRPRRVRTRNVGD